MLKVGAKDNKTDMIREHTTAKMNTTEQNKVGTTENKTETRVTTNIGSKIGTTTLNNNLIKVTLEAAEALEVIEVSEVVEVTVAEAEGDGRSGYPKDQQDVMCAWTTLNGITRHSHAQISRQQ